VDEDHIDEIYSYFKESQTDDLKTAIDELIDCEEEEIRLVRIKFLSELAN
jgi:ATP-dependent DNA helicase RecQ